MGKRTLLLGPNGAGKTTLLKLLSGFMSPTAGQVTYNGSSSHHTLFSEIAWMPQDIQAVRGLRVVEQVRYAAWLSGRSGDEAKRETMRALETVQLVDKAGQLASHLSGGQLRRLGLAQVLVTNSSIMLLDEPTAGLDPAQTKNFREIVRGLDVADGLVVSTHQVGDLGEDFDHVAVLSDGRMVFDGSVEEFHSFGQGLNLRSASVEDIFSHLVQGGLH